MKRYEQITLAGSRWMWVRTHNMTHAYTGTQVGVLTEKYKRLWVAVPEADDAFDSTQMTLPTYSYLVKTKVRA